MAKETGKTPKTADNPPKASPTGVGALISLPQYSSSWFGILTGFTSSANRLRQQEHEVAQELYSEIEGLAEEYHEATTTDEEISHLGDDSPKTGFTAQP